MRKSENTELNPDVIVEYALARKAELQKLLIEKEKSARADPDRQVAQ